jgi:hypothetical protein
VVHLGVVLVDVGLVAVDGVVIVGTRLLGEFRGDDVALNTVDAQQEAGEEGDD